MSRAYLRLSHLFSHSWLQIKGDPFLQDSTEFYQREAATFINENLINEYLEWALSKVVNRNAVTIAANSSTKSSELLALFTNIILQINNDVDNRNIEECIKDIMIVFKYIENEGAFQNFYWRLLADRLVYERSVSIDYEQMMITELQKKCAQIYTSKLQKMIENFNSKEKLMEEYQQHCKSQQSICNGMREKENVLCKSYTFSPKNIVSVDLSIMVLATNLWPFSIVSDFDLPLGLSSSVDNFIQFYYHRHSKQKLIWLYQYSRGELHAYFTRSTYILQASAYEIAILLLYNDSLEWTIQQICKKTRIRTDILIEVLYILITSDVLTCLQINKEDLRETNLQMEHIIRLNDDFTSDKICINLNKPLKTINKDTIKPIEKLPDGDYKFSTQAAIVRIMKNRKTLTQACLIQEVIDQLNNKITTDINLIEQSIEYLINKEYLKHNADDDNILEYLP
ncbi:unnamed protein product [Rotaria sordida]|uniref:Cullin family profile domain-containing protein n=1 Tax=Rotaria sordida TaxID=392033 RepID=A0A814T174_9BILA|nr:unnamed protein product [Rotaria sordida]